MVETMTHSETRHEHPDLLISSFCAFLVDVDDRSHHTPPRMLRRIRSDYLARLSRELEQKYKCFASSQTNPVRGDGEAAN